MGTLSSRSSRYALSVRNTRCSTTLGIVLLCSSNLPLELGWMIEDRTHAVEQTHHFVIECNNDACIRYSGKSLLNYSDACTTQHNQKLL